MENRAKQFMSFDALKGFRKLLEEKEQSVYSKIILSEDDYEELSNKIKNIKDGDNIEIIYFFNNKNISLEGIVSNINFYNRTFIIKNKRINFEDIIKIK